MPVLCSRGENKQPYQPEQACLPCPARGVPTTTGEWPALFIGRSLIGAIEKVDNTRQPPLSDIYTTGFCLAIFGKDAHNLVCVLGIEVHCYSNYFIDF